MTYLELDFILSARGKRDGMLARTPTCRIARGEHIEQFVVIDLIKREFRCNIFSLHNNNPPEPSKNREYLAVYKIHGRPKICQKYVEEFCQPRELKCPVPRVIGQRAA